MLVVMQAAAVVVFMFAHLRYAVGLALFFLAFSPRSLGIILGDGGLSLTFIRVMLPIIIGIFVLSRLIGEAKSKGLKKPAFNIFAFKLLLLLALLKVISSWSNEVVLLYALEDFLFSVVILYLFYSMATEKLLVTVFRFLLCSAIVTCLVAIVEFPFQRPLHALIADPLLLNTEVLEGKIRNGIYRVQGVFDNPLSLAEFGCYMLPVVLFMRLSETGWVRVVAAYSIPLVIVVLILTGSRSAIVVGFITIATYFVVLNWVRLDLKSKIFCAIIILLSFLYLSLLTFDFVAVLLLDAEGTAFYLVDDSKTRSSLSRAIQYTEVVEALSQRPWLGYGVLQNFSDNLEEIHRIDSYYLRLGLEAGYPGIIVFITFLLACLVWVERSTQRIGDSRESIEMRALIYSFICSFASYKMFLSMPTNNIYFYSVLGLLFGVLSLRVERRSKIQRGSMEIPVRL